MRCTHSGIEAPRPFQRTLMSTNTPSSSSQATPSTTGPEHKAINPRGYAENLEGKRRDLMNVNEPSDVSM